MNAAFWALCFGLWLGATIGELIRQSHERKQELEEIKKIHEAAFHSR